ncbi:5-carboxymethyl-2-hydroxymuconate Delta-isomerase [Streptomyces sparsogenes]|uniref:5-carboxymethyl-2-hydroxymuconate Delta-isomerase n=1 Tax=Streptomyces sparsogenes TaxID=67365 RepID=UPI003317C3E1
MPHIVVEYSDTLAEAFDRRAFGLALHPVVAKTVDTTVDACKTRFRRLDEAVIADGAPHHAIIHIEAAILSGRDAENKRALTAAVLEVARAHLAPVPGLAVQITVNVTDLDRAWYAKHAEVHPS